MADFIDLAKPLQLTTPGTAPIAGLTVADTAALEAIESPWPGMFVYVLADGKTYRVTELKEVTVGVFTKKARWRRRGRGRRRSRCRFRAMRTTKT